MEENVFKKLDERIQKAIKKFKLTEPTPIQQLSIGSILSGMNCLLISETGTGKTLAALLPVFHRWLKEKPKPVGILYISPMKALNRDLIEHLVSWSNELGIEVTVRHGDTSQYERKMQVEFPNDMMIVTLETLQPILVGKKIREHLKNVKYVILDELHEVADSKRGVQLALALERLRELCGDFQLLMLSATIGEPEKVANFFSGGRVVHIIQAKTEKEMKIKVIHPKPVLADRRIAKKTFTSVDTAARLRTVMELIRNSRSTLTFTNTRDFAEILTSRIKIIDKKFPLAIHHSSLSKEVRVKAEKQFKEEKLKSLVCTSSLQLGIDIGSVDLTIQYQSPREVTQLVQRVGRSGHALGRTSKGIVITTDQDDIFESAVIARKALGGELDKLAFHEKPYDVLAHQLVGLAFDFGKISLEKAYEIVKRAWPYRNLTYPEFLEVCKQLEMLGLIFLNSYPKRRRRSFEYYFSGLSTIPDVRQYRIFNTLDHSFVGVLDEEFVALHGEPNTTFIVKGEPWRIIAVEGDRVLVEPSSDVEAAVPGWEGELIPVPFEVAQEVGRLRATIAEKLKTESKEVELQSLYPIDKECARKMVDLIKKQAKYGIVPDDKTVLVEDFENLIIIHACFGTKVNETLGRFLTTMLASRLGSVGLRTDPYRIMLQLQQKNVELVKDVLNTKPEYFQSYLELGLSKSELFEWKFVHVAKRFGAISKNAEFGKYTMKKIVEEYSGTSVYKETLRELEIEKLDIEKSVEILKKIQSGEIKLVSKPGLSPLGKLGVKHKYTEIVGPGKPEKEVFELFKQRLLSTKVKLVCMNCGGWEQSYTAGKVADVSCRKCGAKLLATVRPEWRVLPLVRKGLKGKLTPEEKRKYERLRQRADLYLSYRNKAVLALAGRGVGPTTARRILVKFHKTEDEFLEDILEAERNFIRTKRYWSS